MDKIKNKVLQTSDSARYFGQKNHVRGARDSRTRKQTESDIGSIPQVQTRTHLESKSLMPQSTIVQYEDHADDDQDEEIDKVDRIHQKKHRRSRRHMEKMKIHWRIETNRRMKWRMAMRIASVPEERWTSKIIEWNPGVGGKTDTRRIFVIYIIWRKLPRVVYSTFETVFTVSHTVVESVLSCAYHVFFEQTLDFLSRHLQ